MTVGTYFHFRAGCDLARRSGLPIPEFEATEPLPRSSYRKKGTTFNRRELYDVMLSYWDDFVRITNPYIVGTGLERFLMHSSGYAGRVDCVMTIDPEVYEQEVGRNRNAFKINTPKEGDRWLVDLKSSRQISKSYYAQVWAYAQAWNENFPDQKVNRLAILRVNGETGWEMKETRGDKRLWNAAMRAAKEKGVINNGRK